MYQLEVKRWLIADKFPASAGWTISVHVDGMERARGGSHPPDKRDAVDTAYRALDQMEHVQLQAHETLKTADVVVSDASGIRYVIEVEGDSGKQREQQVYSALGQLLVQMGAPSVRYVVAAPRSEAWRAQLAKIPARVRDRLGIECWLVDDSGVEIA